MELVNRTPMVAASNFSDGFVRSAERYLMVVAKATFTFDDSGRIALEPDRPYPLFAEDVPTPLGLLPSDWLPRADPQFEVILLGKAHADGAQPVRRRRVSLTVGPTRRELEIWGDRIWLTRNTVSRARPFDEMPLTYERAFGGTWDVLVDVGSRMRVSDSINGRGRGWDAEGYVEGLGEALRAPAGYPRIPTYVRQLPNIEHPHDPIRRWADAPLPAGWATVPLDIGLRMKWITDRIAGGQPYSEEEVAARAYHRAHPDWIVPLPPAGAVIDMVGLSPRSRVTFQLPALQPVVDILTAGNTFSASLSPQMLVLLPEESRFYLVYRVIASVSFVPEDARGLRLRTENRWGPHDGEGPTPLPLRMPQPLPLPLRQSRSGGARSTSHALGRRV